MTQKLQEPFSNGDEIVKTMEDRWRKLENVDIDDDKDVMYYRAHVSIKDMYAERIFERMQAHLENELSEKEQEVSRRSQIQVLGGESQKEVAKVFDTLGPYKYNLSPELLLVPKYNPSQISKIVSSLNSNGVLWGKEAPEIVKSKDEKLELLTERLE